MRIIVCFVMIVLTTLISCGDSLPSESVRVYTDGGIEFRETKTHYKDSTVIVETKTVIGTSPKEERNYMRRVKFENIDTVTYWSKSFYHERKKDSYVGVSLFVYADSYHTHEKKTLQQR